MMNFFGDAPLAPVIRPMFNVGCLLDIPTGEFVRGKRGEMVLIGGHSYTFSVTGPGNSFKTDLGLFPIMTCLNRYPSHRASVFDTENSIKYRRFQRIAKKMKNISHVDFAAESSSPDPLLTLVQKSDISGDEWFEMVKEAKNKKVKNASKIMRTMPIAGGGGKLIKVMAPTHVLCDTLTQFSVKAVEEKIGKNQIGAKENNMIFMNDGIPKTQMIMQLPNITTNGEIYFVMTAHIGQRFEMDPYAPKPVSLTFSKTGAKVKGVPEKFQQINEHLLEVITTKPLLDKVSKAPLYPLVKEDKEKGNDLFAILAINSRNKNGQSGVAFPFIVSQTEGIKPELTNYGYLKENGKFGIGGNDRNYYLELCPNETMMRTTVREKIETNTKLSRALEIQTEMLQMRKLWRVQEDKHCLPKELYDDIIALGYDWDILLESRGYWMFREDEVDQPPFLSTMDLLNMREGTYHPYWLEEDKVTVKEKHWLL